MSTFIAPGEKEDGFSGLDETSWQSIQIILQDLS